MKYSRMFDSIMGTVDISCLIKAGGAHQGDVTGQGSYITAPGREANNCGVV